MLPILIDENFDHRIIRGLRLRLSQLDCLIVRQIGMSGSEDPALLDWAAKEGRVIVTHDVNTVRFSTCRYDSFWRGQQHRFQRSLLFATCRIQRRQCVRQPHEIRPALDLGFQQRAQRIRPPARLQ